MKLLLAVIFMGFLKSNMAKGWLKSTCQSAKDCRTGEKCTNSKCRPEDTKLMKERFCLINKDCPPMYYCNKNTFKCAIVSTVDQIMQKQPCPKVFKNVCTSDSHCKCNEEKMTCADNECVYSKLQTRKVRIENCLQHHHCNFLNLCDHKTGKCRQIHNNIELMLLFTVQKTRKKDTR